MAESSRDEPLPALAEPSHEAQRYEVHELLGRGGMACVYRATDRASGRQVALKQLTIEPQARNYASLTALFEREFHTLMQLRHPHVISVFDYGLGDEGRPFYTMELLDGGDLRERSPMPWQEACRLLFDVCSSLALLHSRGLLHRDISPRNIRCTQDGHAKLIDFGAMAPTSAGGTEVVGSPAFIAPETVYRLALDARTDLFSLGATLYFALTGRVPFPARSFADVMAAWGVKPSAPSALVPGIPGELDDLVLSLIGLEPAVRPASSFEVMQRLAACAGLAADESDAVSRAYLVTPMLVGRAGLVSEVTQRLTSARMRRMRGMLLSGPTGSGRSRMLDACVLEAKTLGFTVLKAAAIRSRAAFATAEAVLEHLLDALPRLEVDPSSSVALQVVKPAPGAQGPLSEPRLRVRDLADPSLDRVQVRQEIRRLLSSVSRTKPLLIAVDDVHRIDAASAALLAELLDKHVRGGLLVVLTADSDEPANPALSALSARCDSLELKALTRDQTQKLLASVFGDLAHLEALATEIHGVAAGNPGECMKLAQYLVDQGQIRYAAGRWTLPSRISAADLPRSAVQATQARIAGMSELARFLGEAQSLAFYETFADDDYRALVPDASSGAVEMALAELLAEQALVRDDTTYTLANRVWSAAFAAALSPDETQRRHRTLVAMYEKKSAAIAIIHHAFAGGMAEHGLRTMARMHDGYKEDFDHKPILEQNVGKMVWVYGPAEQALTALGASRRDLFELRRWQYGGSLSSEGADYTSSAQLLREQLIRDSGLDLYWSDTQSTNDGERLMRALQGAQERYLATPEPERGFSVEDAIHRLAEYVVVSIAVGGRSQNAPLLRSLPELLAPFAVLSPVLDAIHKNAIATDLNFNACRSEACREIWRGVLAALDGMSATDMQVIDAVRNAVAYAIGLTEAQLGIPTASSWADRLDADPYQRVSALTLRKIVRLYQGDSAGAEKLHRQAEVAALQSGTAEMFKSLLIIEIWARTRARDLVGIQQVTDKFRTLAERYPAWVPNVLYGEGSFHLARGDYDAAERRFAECVAMCRPDATAMSLNMTMWIAGNAALAETLFSMDRFEEARAVASAAWDDCSARQTGSQSFDLARFLALAEARLGISGAEERLDWLIQQLEQLGTTGLRLGYVLEARAQVALWRGDQAGFEHFARLTAREYRHGGGSPLGARYERLMNEALRSGMSTSVSLSDFASATVVGNSTAATDDMLTTLSRSMAEARGLGASAQVALRILCTYHAANAGHLYLVSPEGVSLQATQGTAVPDAELAEIVQEYVDRNRDRSNALDDMITGEPLEAEPAATMVEIAQTSYELVLLRSLSRPLEDQVIGAAAISIQNAPPANDQRRQLLNVLADELARAASA